ncbi:MAG: c-type cytochrome [Pirellulaceae bacterium]
MSRIAKLGILAALIAAAIVGAVASRRSSEPPAMKSYRLGSLTHALAQVSQQAQTDANDVLLVADCYRQLGNVEACIENIGRARSAGPQFKQAADLRMALLRIQNGKLDGDPLKLIETLVTAGADPNDARAAVISGTLANAEWESAEALLGHWKQATGDTAAHGHLSAVLANLTGDVAKAEGTWITVIERYPSYELAWLALSEAYVRPPNVRFPQAKAVLVRAASAFPENPEIPVKLARVRRRLGEADQAVDALMGLNADSDNQMLLAEAAAASWDCGRYADALEYYRLLGLQEPAQLNHLTDSAFSVALQSERANNPRQSETLDRWTSRVRRAATAHALRGNAAAAASIFAVSQDRVARLRRLEDVKVRQLITPQDQQLTDENNALSSPAFTPNYPTLEQLQPGDTSLNIAGMHLYTSLCANCHGQQGDGFGAAGANLCPPPRSFRSEPLRLVSATNRLATDGDIAKVIREGIPGTSMPAFEKLSDQEVALLIEVVRTLIRQGIESLANRDVGTSAQADWITARTVPEPAIVLPPLTTTAEQIELGSKLFRMQGCSNCHSVDTPGEYNSPPLFDSLGRPMLAPNLVHDPFHGGQDIESIYQRIALGIPGTPHPAVSTGDPADIPVIQALAAYVASIRHHPSEQQMDAEGTTNFSRQLRLSNAGR